MTCLWYVVGSSCCARCAGPNAVCPLWPSQQQPGQRRRWRGHSQPVPLSRGDIINQTYSKIIFFVSIGLFFLIWTIRTSFLNITFPWTTNTQKPPHGNMLTGTSFLSIFSSESKKMGLHTLPGGCWKIRSCLSSTLWKKRASDHDPISNSNINKQWMNIYEHLWTSMNIIWTLYEHDFNMFLTWLLLTIGWVEMVMQGLGAVRPPSLRLLRGARGTAGSTFGHWGIETKKGVRDQHP